MSIPPFCNRIRVRYAEIDGQGVVFNAHWLTYFDDSCTRFMESLGFGPDFWVSEFDVMLVKATLEWSGPARFDEWIDIVVEPTRLGTKSFDLRYTAAVGERPACRAVITYVAIEPGSNASIEIPARVRTALDAASRSRELTRVRTRVHRAAVRAGRAPLRAASSVARSCAAPSWSGRAVDDRAERSRTRPSSRPLHTAT